MNDPAAPEHPSGGSSRLLPLSGSGRRIAGEEEDIREWTVRDTGGEELGSWATREN